MNDEAARSALGRAFEQENLLPVYQAIHDARSGAIFAAEALLRQRRESGEIRNAGFITAAAEQAPDEDLCTLNSVVMRLAFSDAAHWQTGGSPDVLLNVNLSPREFESGGSIMPRLLAHGSSCGIDLRRVALEITETSYIENPEQTVGLLEELRDAGVALWLDDFGTGHSSVEHLQHFPLDGLKIPATFVKELESDRKCRAITAGLISLAHDIGLRVIAEGVEHPQQRDFLLEHGCDYIQGFLFSRPMQRVDFEEFLARREL